MKIHPLRYTSNFVFLYFKGCNFRIFQFLKIHPLKYTSQCTATGVFWKYTRWCTFWLYLQFHGIFVKLISRKNIQMIEADEETRPTPTSSSTWMANVSDKIVACCLSWSMAFAGIKFLQFLMTHLCLPVKLFKTVVLSLAIVLFLERSCQKLFISAVYSNLLILKDSDACLKFRSKNNNDNILCHLTQNIDSCEIFTTRFLDLIVL